MKKLSHGLGIVAIGLTSVLSAACSSSTDNGTPATSGGSTGAGGTGSTGGSTSIPVGGGTQLQSPAYFTLLTGAEVTMGTAAPMAWTTQGCNICHGSNAEGTMSAPENRFTPTDYAVYAVRNGRKTPSGAPSLMVAFPSTGTTPLSDADLTAINTWQNSFPKPADGQGMYRVMCGNCHGPMMASGGSAPIALTGKTKAIVEMFVRQGNGTDPSNRALYMPKFDTTLLTDADLALIETYVGAM